MVIKFSDGCEVEVTDDFIYIKAADGSESGPVGKLEG